MNIKEFTDEFLRSDFAKRNIYTHLQMGYPLPVPYKNGVAIRFLFHKLSCNKEQITLSEPRFEIVLAYPSGRILYFSELDNNRYNAAEAAITKQKAAMLAYSFKQVCDNCDELLQFYNTYSRVTGIMYKKYYENLTKASSNIGLGDWYGGVYDPNSSI